MENELLIRIDGASLEKRADFYAAVRAQLPDEAMPGSNLDALHDALTDLPFAAVEITDSEAAEAALGNYWLRIRKVLAVCEQENPGLTIRTVPQDTVI